MRNFVNQAYRKQVDPLPLSYCRICGESISPGCHVDIKIALHGTTRPVRAQNYHYVGAGRIRERFNLSGTGIADSIGWNTCSWSKHHKVAAIGVIRVFANLVIVFNKMVIRAGENCAALIQGGIGFI